MISETNIPPEELRTPLSFFTGHQQLPGPDPELRLPELYGFITTRFCQSLMEIYKNLTKMEFSTDAERERCKEYARRKKFN